MNKKRLKQIVGIDCGKDYLVVSFGYLDENLKPIIVSTEVFPNNKQGMSKLLKWVNKLDSKDVAILFLVEATGVYHEELCMYIHSAQQRISVVVPSQSSSFFKSLKIKRINDKECAKGLCIMGLEKDLPIWQPPKEIFSKMRGLTRERHQTVEKRTIVKNQLHSENHSYHGIKESKKRLKAQIVFFDKQIKSIESELRLLVNTDTELSKNIKNITSIDGVGFITAVTVVAEVNGFALFKNNKQLVSYAGLDVVSKDSGTSVHGKQHISKKGNKYLRACLYCPSASAIKKEGNLENLYTRVAKSSGIKGKGRVAVQRKLLILIFTIWKNGQTFDRNFKQVNKGKQNNLTLLNKVEKKKKKEQKETKVDKLKLKKKGPPLKRTFAV